MPAGSGSRPSNASSGAVEAECQHEAEADEFDGYADEDGIDDIDDIDDIEDMFQTMVRASMRVIVVKLLLLLLVLPVTILAAGRPIVLSMVWPEYFFMALLTMLLWLFVTHFDDQARIGRQEAAGLLLSFLAYQFFVLLN